MKKALLSLLCLIFLTTVLSGCFPKGKKFKPQHLKHLTKVFK